MGEQHHEGDVAYATILEGEIAERLIEMAEIIGPDDTIAYVDKIAAQMRAEVDELGDDGEGS